MGKTVIRADGLSKEYVIGAREAGRETFREMLTASFAAPFRRFRRLAGGAAPEERIWALKDVSFEVAEGEVVGIIGRNGAGKSTLLKILSRITEPTEGRVEIRGRVASLLEVGTGFHPELTGRENIHLNGAILGMSRAEIDRKFDEIVEFAGIGPFVDTPVKRYSSGMTVRLAFSIAAHLDADILLVDEVLAVGDIAFQEKCINRMNNIASRGKTVLFVSHNAGAVRSLCRSGIVLEDGKVSFAGSADDALEYYSRLYRMTSDEGSKGFKRIPAQGEGTVESVKLFKDGKENPIFECGSDAQLSITCSLFRPVKEIVIHVVVNDMWGSAIGFLGTDIAGFRLHPMGQQVRAECILPKLALIPGFYSLDVFLVIDGYLSESVQNAAKLRIIDGMYFRSGRIPPAKFAKFIIDHSWHLSNDAKT